MKPTQKAGFLLPIKKKIFKKFFKPSIFQK